MSTNFSTVSTQIRSINFGTIDINPKEFAAILQRYIVQGSQRYTLSLKDIQVYANPSWDIEGKETTSVIEIDGKTVANTLEGLLAVGTRFLDAVVFLSLPNNQKPSPEVHPIPKSITPPPQIATYNNHSEIAKCMFFSFFYLLTRARAHAITGYITTKVVPSFLKNVLSISRQPHEVADYLSSFDMNNLDPAWIRHIVLKDIGREALNRFGLGVAGYRLTAPFKLREPNRPGWETYKNAVEVAKSFATEPACWNFHPATRDPDLLTRYGNINKNLGNLILLVYTNDTIEELVSARTLYQKPPNEVAYTNFTTWTPDMAYKCADPIFKKST